MNAVDFLKGQHREVEELFSQLEETKDKSAQSKERKALVNDLIMKLTLHTRIEESILYPEGKEIDEDMTLEAYEEHECVKDVLKKLSKLRTNDETFMAKITVLKELVEHHVEEEEKEYFPQLEEELGSKRLEELGQELEASFERLQKRGNSSRRPKLTLAKAS